MGEYKVGVACIALMPFILAIVSSLIIYHLRY